MVIQYHSGKIIYLIRFQDPLIDARLFWSSLQYLFVLFSTVLYILHLFPKLELFQIVFCFEDFICCRTAGQEVQK